jgi:hypothetical protein
MIKQKHLEIGAAPQLFKAEKDHVVEHLKVGEARLEDDSSLLIQNVDLLERLTQEGLFGLTSAHAFAGMLRRKDVSHTSSVKWGSQSKEERISRTYLSTSRRETPRLRPTSLEQTRCPNPPPSAPTFHRNQPRRLHSLRELSASPPRRYDRLPHMRFLLFRESSISKLGTMVILNLTRPEMTHSWQERCESYGASTLCLERGAPHFDPGER